MPVMKRLIVTALTFALMPGLVRAQSPVGTSGASTSTPRPAPAASTATTSADYRLAAGDIPAAGRTSIELRNAIAGALEEYIAKPVVTVIVTETTPQVIYITGEVNKPGALPVT